MGIIQPSTADINGYTLTVFTPTLSIDSVLAVIEYSFNRKTLWATETQTYANQMKETQPQQGVVAFEFTIHRTNAAQTEIDALQSFFASTHGPATPFLFTAPDDGQVYNVCFKDPELAVTVNSADVRSYTFGLVTVQVDNTPNAVIGSQPQNRAISWVLSITSAWTADYDNLSHAEIHTVGNGGFLLKSTNVSWGKMTETFDVSSLPLSMLGGIRGNLNVLFTSSNYQATSPSESPLLQHAEFQIYDLFLTVTYQNGATRIFRPTSYVFFSGGNPVAVGTLTNGANMIDGNLNTYGDYQVLRLYGLLANLAFGSNVTIQGFA